MAGDSIPNPERLRSPKRANARGVKLGRKPKLTDHQKREVIRRRGVDGETVREIACSYNVSHSTISRLAA
jgi:DNA invertase Pin-like site-specific DNA recombinase